eukprot:GHVR01116739.1.p1 GENE.GHVR01116739.1~~GHVR01116739.1.p1  ORF type:complete len:202 (-),score=60.20 GHVR01116739.1:48-653(-)
MKTNELLENLHKYMNLDEKGIILRRCLDDLFVDNTYDIEQQMLAVVLLSLSPEPTEVAANEFIRNLPNGEGAKSRCGVVWKSNHVAYRCITCGFSPSACICVECFKAGNHEGHDFSMYKSGMGGCCDCGDVDTWAVSGFCCKHKLHSEDFEPDRILPDITRNISFNIINVVIQKLLYVMLRGCIINTHTHTHTHTHTYTYT